MNIYLAFTLFTLIGVVYLVIAEIFTMLFRFTGLPEEKARFQVISLLTGCGFTTHESELFLNSKGRRRLARYTMLFGSYSSICKAFGAKESFEEVTEKKADGAR